METIWELIAPYIAMVGGTTGAGMIIYIILRLLLSKITVKNTSALSSMFNVDILSQNVVDRIAGKTLNIDVTAVTERALKKLQKQLDGKITAIELNTNSYRHLLALMGNALTKLKALTPDEKTELAKAIKTIESEYIVPEIVETMTVVLAPISLENNNVDIQDADKGGVNFEGLE